MLVRTSELYWSCPDGHGKLVPTQNVSVENQLRNNELHLGED